MVALGTGITAIASTSSNGSNPVAYIANAYSTYKWFSTDPTIPAAPAVTGVDTTVAGVSDGQITGTTATMEYANNPEFTDATDCTESATTSLTAGVYYVRYKAAGENPAGLTTKVLIGNGAPAVEYGLWVGKTRVNSLNAADIFGDGTASFVPRAGETPGKLTLNGLTITAEDSGVVPWGNCCGIATDEMDLDIHLQGTNSIAAAEAKPGKRSYGIQTSRLTITSDDDGTLTVTGVDRGLVNYGGPS